MSNAPEKKIPDWADTDLTQTNFGVVDFDYDQCNGCTWCVQACPPKALEMNEKKPRMIATPECMFCGNCQAICPKDAVTLKTRPQWPGYFTIVERGEQSRPRMKW